ncbi:Enriched in surface-labeled proteome protein 16 [Novymonas esmeraldas]|uniref:Enriched in surface-labeled proteome protein 16 n=1 Tax=Novymonas esmeraldas TaxID=1808958 RepID=A0AAW0F3G6_9TRYP
MSVSSSRRSWSPLLRLAIPFAVLLLHVCASFPFVSVAAAPTQGRSVRRLHGAGYEHLDCSACITVARTLFYRLNETIAHNPSTYLISHRLSKENQLRRRAYRNSELLVTEVMENICISYQNDERSLRLHPKSKVRLYHQQVYGDVRLGVRHALREDELYPADADPAQWADRLDGHRYPVARLYSPKDAEALHGLHSFAAAPTMCALLVEEFEEELEDLVKTARSHAEVEYGLCGMALPPGGAVPTLHGVTGEADDESSVRPITNVCANEEALRAAAHQDQLRWAQFQRREARGKAERAEKRERTSTSAGAATDAPTDAAPDVDPATDGDVAEPPAVGNEPADAAGADGSAAPPPTAEDGDGDL